MRHTVILDGFSTNPGDLSWEAIAQFGTYDVYDRTYPDEIVKRAEAADIIISNKVVFDESTLTALPKLRCITLLATGYNVIDTAAASRAGVTVCNVRGYSTNSVAQHVFALLLNLASGISKHQMDVAEGGWSKAQDATYYLQSTIELAGKTMGIYGFGNIGRKVAEIARAFEMKVVSNHKHPERDACEGVAFVSFEEMLQNSDVLSLHAPLSMANTGIINRKHLSLMKPSAFLINTGRGGLIQENDLKWALEEEIIAGAALDVLSVEPPVNGNILIGTKNCIITPHIAWVTVESRQRLIDETILNIRAFLAGSPRNVVF
jgi:glycerate dehydrogenase